MVLFFPAIMSEHCSSFLQRDSPPGGLVALGPSFSRAVRHKDIKQCTLRRRRGSLSLPEDTVSIPGALVHRLSPILLKYWGSAGTWPHSGWTRINSVGTVPASLVTYASILALKPDLFINAGTAGGFKVKGACIFDVFLGPDKYRLGRRKSFSTPNLVKELNIKVIVY
ncbi:nucleoside phosphorylase [Artemisia annua]|uniref:Nucleoside phosphorylase n=1 Tax=Artemisia annua TaxID=35608 RepID=A0A2U1KCN7_ARTAN|nr:nucleoside phosphorylase [Artemisia annua]